MDTQRCRITSDCWIEVTTYNNGAPPLVSLEYVEHSQNHWHDNRETSVEISPEKARELIAFLEQCITPTPEPPTDD